jgi:predicted lysophospholipase L1 biosynthesis ABC-type transport system permease subunit
MSLLAGREFSDSDIAGRPRVAVVNEALARRLWKNPARVGERIRFVASDETGEWAEVVGIVRDVHHDGPDRDVKPEAYWCLAQEGWRSLAFAVRTTSPPANLVSPIQDVLRRLAPDVPLYAVRPMQEIYDASVASRRFLADITTVFAGTALILAAVGTFSVTRYVVGLRRREWGVRLALGATPSEIRRLVLRQTLGYGLGGIVLGAVGALVLGRFVQSLLFEVSASDPTIVGAAAAVLLAVAGLAGYGPARQASRLDPLSVLRAE